MTPFALPLKLINCHTVREFDETIQEHFGQLNTQELSLIRSYFYEEKLSRNDFFTKSGKICDRLSIVRSGILRIYALTDSKEITQWLSTENFLVTEVMGFFYEQPNRWNIRPLPM